MRSANPHNAEACPPRRAGALAGVGAVLLACLFACALLLLGFTRPASAQGEAVRRGHAEAAGRWQAVSQRAIVTPDRRRHILDGDRTGGGHRPGTGSPGKSEFPQGWSDDRIIEAIEDVANDPASVRTPERNSRTVVEGRRDGVFIRVVVGSDGRTIITGYPTNVQRNPRPVE